MSPTLAANGDIAGTKSASGRIASVYSEVQKSRIDHELPLPSVLRSSFKLVDGPASSAAGNPGEIAKLFPNLFGQPSAKLVPSESDALQPEKNLNIGVVLSGGQAPGGHNVICGIFDYLQERAKGSTLYGFRGGPAGIMKCKYVELNTEYIYPYRNQEKSWPPFDAIAGSAIAPPFCWGESKRRIFLCPSKKWKFTARSFYQVMTTHNPNLLPWKSIWKTKAAFLYGRLP